MAHRLRHIANRRFLHVAAGLVALGALGGAPGLHAQPGDHQPAGCATCATPINCTITNEPGMYSTGCSIAAGGTCKEEFGICYIDGGLAMDELRLREGDLLPALVSGERVTLARVGGSRFAAWNCGGTLAFLAERAPDGTLTPIPTEQHRHEYAYDRLVSAAHGRTAHAVPAPEPPTPGAE